MVKAKCEKCGYDWDSKSHMVMVSCPSCGNKTKIRDKYDKPKEVKKKQKIIVSNGVKYLGKHPIDIMVEKNQL